MTSWFLLTGRVLKTPSQTLRLRVPKLVNDLARVVLRCPLMLVSLVMLEGQVDVGLWGPSLGLPKEVGVLFDQS